MSRKIRCLAAALALALLTAGTAQARSLHPRSPSPGFFDALWQWLAGHAQQASELIDPERDPRLLLCTRHNLIFYHADLGRFLEAQKLYQEARSLYRSFNEPWVQNRWSWVRGKIARGLGQLRQAETRFLAARDGFVKEGVPYDTALVSLELALLYAEQGRTAELKRLAADMVPVFASRHVHREALAALTFLQQAVEAERASVEVVVQVADFLRKSEHDPELRFEAGG